MFGHSRGKVRRMDIKEMLNLVKSGEMGVDEAQKILKDLPYEDLG